MHLAYLSNSQIPSRYANSIHVMQMCQAFSQMGHEVTLYAYGDTSSAASDFEYYGVEPCFSLFKQHRSALPIVGHLRYARASARSAAAKGADLYYSRNIATLFYLADRTTPLVFEAHVPHRAFWRYMASKVFNRPNFTRLVVISAALGREYARIFPKLDISRIVVAHDAANPTSGKPGNLGLPIDRSLQRLQVGYIGSLSTGKGIETVVAIARRMQDVDFHVIGGKHASEIQRWRDQAKSVSNLLFHGFVTPRETDRWRAMFDVVLAPYRREVIIGLARTNIANWMSPLKIFEYMAAGKAIVASDLPVLREVLHGDVDALLVDPDDEDAWIAAINRLRDREFRALLGRTSQERFLAQHTWHHRAQQVLGRLGACSGSKHESKRRSHP